MGMGERGAQNKNGRGREPHRHTAALMPPSRAQRNKQQVKTVEVHCDAAKSQRCQQTKSDSDVAGEETLIQARLRGNNGGKFSDSSFALFQLWCTIPRALCQLLVAKGMPANGGDLSNTRTSAFRIHC